MNSHYLSLLNTSDFIDTSITQVFTFYRQCYLNNSRYQNIVDNPDRIPDKYQQHPMIGVSNRTLGLQMPCRKTSEGGEIRGALLQVGLLKATGHELFRGCIVFPRQNEVGQITSAVGYRYGARIRHWQQPVIYWHRPDNQHYITKAMSDIREGIYGKA